MTGQPVWQSLLFVPVGAERHLASAIRHRPDAIILDLEDAVPAEGKEAARQKLRHDQAAIRDAGISCLLRVNAPLGQMVQDLAAADSDRLDGVLVPKVEQTRPLLNAAELVAAPLVALVESPAALPALAAIAVCPNVVGLMLGSEDYSATMGIHPEGGGLDMPFAHLAAAAAVGGVLAIGFPGSIAEFRNLDRYRANLTRGKALGMTAVAAIHPAQLPVIAEVLTPSEAERSWAERVLRALQSGSGVAVVDGAMVDAPVLARAQRILARLARAR